MLRSLICNETVSDKVSSKKSEQNCQFSTGKVLSMYENDDWHALYQPMFFSVVVDKIIAWSQINPRWWCLECIKNVRKTYRGSSEIPKTFWRKYWKKVLSFEKVDWIVFLFCVISWKLGSLHTLSLFFPAVITERHIEKI